MSKNFKGIYGAKGGGIGSLLGISEQTQPAEVKPLSELAGIDSAVKRIQEEPLMVKAVGSANISPATGKPKRGRPQTNYREVEKSSQTGCLEKETRATFIVNEEDLEKFKAVAYWERLSLKEAIGTAIKDYIGKYEQKNGAVKPVSRSK